MRRSVFAVVVCAGLFLIPKDALAICGSVVIENSSWQYGNSRTVEAIIRTSREITPCPLEVQVEAWIDQLNAGAQQHRAAYVAELHLVWPVPLWGVWKVYGKHWLIWFLGLTWDYMGTTVSHAIINEPPPSPQEECALQGGTWNYTTNQCEWVNCPLILDPDRNGFKLTSLEDGVYFDL